MTAAQRELLDKLRDNAERRAAAERAELALLRAARTAGLSWAQIATALELRTRQAAEQRFRRLSSRTSQDPAPEHSAWPTATPGPARSSTTHRRIVDAAGRVLAEKGYTSTRMSDIAAEAGLRAGSLYHYFGSKDDLVAEVLRYGVQVVHGQVRALLDSLPPDAPPSVRLDAAMAAHLRALLDLNAVARAHPHVFSQAPRAIRDQVRPYRRAYGALWARITRQAQEAGVLRDDIDGFVVRLFLVNSLEVMPLWAERSHLSTATLSQLVRRLLLEGAGKPGHTEPTEIRGKAVSGA
ncbi:TetR/AcrR family transcriptional regulator [Pseudonocardia spinosispora]|uniref:TetR/AcrR family transcriptional regulator n=1 Tax=Pseudonocardia spinosispora TaxID=103441 RepID=UPI000416C6DA|nr:TetR/AcrR family transcriptional regulator [Pseudonocardia spinosispora]